MVETRNLVDHRLRIADVNATVYQTRKLCRFFQPYTGCRRIFSRLMLDLAGMLVNVCFFISKFDLQAFYTLFPINFNLDKNCN